jgi:AcrR family transcriptional regulator
MPKLSERQLETVKDIILRESKILFNEYGLKRISIDDIVTACDLNQEIFYQNFSSKENLYMEIFKEDWIKWFTL